VGAECGGEMDTETTEEEEAVVNVFSMMSKISGEKRTYKNGIQVRVSVREPRRLRLPNLYSRIVYPTVPAPGKTTIQASQISKECM